MPLILSISGQVLLLLTSGWMLKTWLPKDGKPGWYAAAFCSGLLITLYSASALLTHLLPSNLHDLIAQTWMQQLAWYAAFPLLSFVLLALAFHIDWPKESWGRILLGVCGIYWLSLQTQNLTLLLLISSGISSSMIIRLVLQNKDKLCIKQRTLIISCASLALALLVFTLFISGPNIGLDITFAILLYAINRGLLISKNNIPKKEYG